MEHEISTFGSLMVMIGFIGWISSTVALIFRGFDTENHMISRKALFWGLMIVAFYAIWIAGLKIA